MKRRWRRKGEETLHQMKKTTTYSRASMGRPRITHKHTHKQTREPFSQTDRSKLKEVAGISFPSDRLASRYLLPPRSSHPFDLPLSTLNCKSDLSKALGYLHTQAHTAI